jgi:hypothetical protein
VISEIKLRTPRDGDLLKGRSPIDLARRGQMEYFIGTAVMKAQDVEAFL